ATAGRERERARVNELERLAIDAQLRTLQAQIEPHFLFNTLANVSSLIDAQPVQARRMLERLIELLRASLTAARQPSATLAQESRLLSAYLEILQLRMGDRLRYTIEIPELLGGASIPPLSLQPLVENAIRHGLEPKVEGGRVQVKASAADDRLEICVEDDGLGFAPRTDAGFGLSNLRDRLAAMYGGGARMSIEDRAPGTRVRISLPLILASVT
ncbi:MAG: sensor histidine kinase, partial [Burkholderiaceae bacterium]